MKQIIKIILICMVLSSCKGVETTGYNEEIEKVLKHYKTEDIDKQKYDAVRFLADNMPGHSTMTFAGQDGYIRSIDSLYGDRSYHIRKVLYNLPIHMGYAATHKRDVDEISSEYLISHIDYWFDVWRTTPWLSELSFDDFLEYLLPYRFLNENLQQDEHLSFRKNIDTLVNLSRDYEWIKYNIHNHIEWHDFYSFPDEEKFVNDSIYIPAPINREIKLDCVQMAIYYAYYYRQHGIPSAIDFVPHWGHIAYRHFWCAAIDGVFVYNTKGWFSSTMTPKVYRMTFKHNPIIEDGENKVPDLFRNPFVADVTKDYVAVSEANIKPDFSNVDKKPKYAYLAVFNCKDLHEIAISEVSGRKATFENMGRRIVYYPVCYEGFRQKSLGYPFYIDSNEELHYFIPDHAQLETHKITRKYLTEAQKIFWSTNMLGSIVEGANNPDFRDKKLICRITEHNQDLNTLKIPVGEKYRYVRFSTPKDSVDLSVFRLYGKSGQILPKTISSATDNRESFKNLSDTDVLTYHTSKGSFTFDMGEIQAMERLEIAPRTDDNDIVAGEHYELLYYDLNGWNSLGHKMADTSYVEYSGMPKGAIFWLRNLTKGVEERVFSYGTDGKQRFW